MNLSKGLVYAVDKNDVEKVKKLLEKEGIEVNGQDNLGFTPLCSAARHSSTEIIELLIDAGANVNLADKSGNFPLHCAAQTQRQDVVELLIKQGADRTQKNAYGRVADDFLDGKLEGGLPDFLSETKNGHVSSYLMFVPTTAKREGILGTYKQRKISEPRDDLAPPMAIDRCQSG